MPSSIFDPAARRVLLDRLDALGPDAQRQWGTMDLPKAISHMGDQLRLALGEIEVKAIPSPIGLPGLRTLLVRYMPFPKGVKTAPELLVTDIATLDEARSWLIELIERVVDRGVGADWTPHPLFGALSGQDWGILIVRHIDHHLRQFGV